MLRRIVFIFAGFVLLIAGIAMLVLPGPAFLVIPAALALLGTECLWARRINQWIAFKVRLFLRRVRGWYERRSQAPKVGESQ